MTVLTATAWPTNADMILAVRELGYINDDDFILDTTYGDGKWWTKWMPKGLQASDLHKGGAGIWSDDIYVNVWDFTDLPAISECYDVVCFDPPYVAVGGRKTSTTQGMTNAYGMATTAKDPAGQQEIINAGLAECVRVTKHRGIILVKCQNYVSSGKHWPGVYETLKCAETLGCRVEDQLVHTRPSAGPQPTMNRDGTPRKQKHSRSNTTTLLVLRKWER